MGVSIVQWRAAIGCWCRGGSSGGHDMNHPTSDVVGTARYQAVPLLLLAALLAIGGVESNPGPQGYMFNSDFRDAIKKLKEEMEQQKTAMEQQTTAMEQLKMAMEQQKVSMEQQKVSMEQQMEQKTTAVEQKMEQKNMTVEQLEMAMKQLTNRNKTMEHQMEQQKKAMEQQMEQQKKAMEHQMEQQKKAVEQQMEQQKKAMEHQMEQQKKAVEHQMEQQKKAMEHQTEQQKKAMEQQMEQLKKAMEQQMEQQKTAMEPLTPAGRKRQLDAAFNKLPEEHPGIPNMQQAQAGSSIHRLLVACQLGEKSLVESLLDEYPDSRDKAEFINTDVGGWYALLCASSAGHADVVSLLITSGADVTVRDGLQGLTGLMWASFLGHVSVVRVLLDSFTDDKKRADYINMQTSGGLSVLSLATGNKHQDVVDLLRKSGAKR